MWWKLQAIYQTCIRWTIFAGKQAISDFPACDPAILGVGGKESGRLLLVSGAGRGVDSALKKAPCSRMELDLEGQLAERAYPILASLVVPRPIALVTTLSLDGKLNAAPFSFFNLLGADPPILAVAPGTGMMAPLKTLLGTSD